MFRAKTNRFAATFLIAFTVALASCQSDAPQKRGPVDKADLFGSCEGVCGSSAEGCFCDEQCEDFGDCCDDYAAECSQGSECGPTEDVVAVADALADPDDACHSWVSSTFGRSVRVGGSSGSVWTRRNDFGLGVVTSAAHTRGEGFFGPAGTDIPTFFDEPSAVTSSGFVHQPLADGSAHSELAAGTFLFFHPEIPAAESGNKLRDILPRHDFFLTVIDNQQIASAQGQVMGDLVRDELVMHDPEELTSTAPTFVDVQADEDIMLLGVPHHLGGQLVYSVGRVLSTAEADALMLALADVGDEEGMIPFDPEVEFFIEATGHPGMSGGGVYSASGRQAGIMVRATTTPVDGSVYVRAVRMSFVVAELSAAFESATPDTRALTTPFLEPELR
jgi:hypothetical protein